MKKIYKCDFCNFTNELEGVVSFHEAGCVHDPTNKACQTCSNLVSTMGELWEYDKCTKGVDKDTRTDIVLGIITCTSFTKK